MEKSNRQFSSTEKILDILFLFLIHQELTAQQISKKLSLPLSSTYKYLEILLNRDLLGKTAGSTNYCLGLMAYKLGKLFLKNKNFLTASIPYMKSLSSQINETTFLSVISGWEMIIIEKVEPSLPFRLSVELNTKVPLHIGAAAKVLLAYQSKSFIEVYINKELSKYDGELNTDVNNLQKQLVRIKKTGYYYAESEAQSWLKAIAAPIFDYKKKIIASIAIVMPYDRLTDEAFDNYVDLIKKSASDITRVLSEQKESFLIS